MHHEQKIPYIAQGLSVGLSLGVIATAVAGPEIADLVSRGVQTFVNNQWVAGYRHDLDVVRNLEPGFQRYVLGFMASLPTVAVPVGLLGLAKGVYNKTASLLGWKPKIKPTVKTGEREWGSDPIQRYLHAAYHMSEYRIAHRLSRDEASYRGMRQVTAEMITNRTQHTDMEQVNQALDTLVEEEIQAIPTDIREKTSLAHKIKLLDNLADCVISPNKYTYTDRLSVTNRAISSASLLGFVATASIAYSRTHSIIQSALLALCVSAALETIGIYGGSTLLFRRELRERKEKMREVYKRFEAKLELSQTDQLR